MTAEPNDISTELSQKDPLTNDHENKYRLKAAAFLATISGFGFLAGFGGALAAVKKQEPTSFEQGLALKTSKRVNNIYFLNTIKSLQAYSPHLQLRQFFINLVILLISGL